VEDNMDQNEPRLATYSVDPKHQILSKFVSGLRDE